MGSACKASFKSARESLQAVKEDSLNLVHIIKHEILAIHCCFYVRTGPLY